MKKILIILVISFLQGCGVISVPIMAAMTPISYPIGYAVTELSKPYYNPDYVVTEECAKDATRAAIAFTGASMGNIRIGSLMSTVIHTAPHTIKNELNSDNILSYILMPGAFWGDFLDGEGYSHIDIADEKSNPNKYYQFSFSESGSNLEMNLEKYKEDPKISLSGVFGFDGSISLPKDDMWNFTLTNNFAGAGSIDLPECKI